MSKYTELIEKHGSLEEFIEACERAYHDLFITWEEKEKGIEEYRKELEDAKTKNS